MKYLEREILVTERKEKIYTGAKGGYPKKNEGSTRNTFNNKIGGSSRFDSTKTLQKNNSIKINNEPRSSFFATSTKVTPTPVATPQPMAMRQTWTKEQKDRMLEMQGNADNFLNDAKNETDEDEKAYREIRLKLFAITQGGVMYYGSEL